MLTMTAVILRCRLSVLVVFARGLSGMRSSSSVDQDPIYIMKTLDNLRENPFIPGVHLVAIISCI